MREEHMMILEMLEEGKITSEEAAALIEALEEAVEAEEEAVQEGGEGREDREAARPVEGHEGAAGESGGPTDSAAGGTGAAGAPSEGAQEAGEAGETEEAGETGEAREAGESGRVREAGRHGPDFTKIRMLADKLSRLAEIADGPALESLAERIEKTVEKAMREKERVVEQARREEERTMEKLKEGISEAHRHYRVHDPAAWIESFTEPFLGAFAPGFRVKKVLEGAFDEQLKSIDIEATTSNGSITIEPWDGAGFRVEVRARVRNTTGDPAVAQARLEEAIDYEATPGRLRIDCSGAKVVSGASLVIQLPRSFQYDLELESSNGKVEIGRLECGRVEVETSNGRISFDGQSADAAELETSNGRIQCMGAAKRLVAETSNGSIFVAPARVTGDAAYELETSNGSIEVQLASDDDVGYSIEAETSQGDIHVDLPNLVYQVNTRSVGHKEIVASTPGYDEKANRLQVKAETSNGSITITGASRQK